MGILFGKQKTLTQKSLVTFGLLVVASIFTTNSALAQYGPYGGPGPVPNGTVNAATPLLHPGQSLSATPNPPDATTPAVAPNGVVSNSTTQAPASAVPEFTNPLYKILYGFVITVFGKIFGWSGAIFDVGLNSFLLGFGDLYYNHNVGVAVEETWKIVRDLFNLTFIFGLVYIGFKMILDADDHHGRKMLVNLIGAALLVNFSLFIIKFLIDISDITASVIAKGFSTTTSISNAFINVINLGTILKLSGEHAASLETSGNALAYIFGIMIFFAVASFVFAAGGILLMIRFIVLNIYLVFSPIMFIGWVFPSFSHHSKKYMDGFLGQAFFAPAYLLMLYLSYKVLSTYANVQEVNYGDLFVDGPVNASSAEMAIPFFILAMVFLVASLVVAKNMGAVGASTAISFGNKLRGNVQSMFTGGAGYAAYKSIDRLANSQNAMARIAGRSLTYAGARDAGYGAYKSSPLHSMNETSNKRFEEMNSRASESKGKAKIAAALKSGTAADLRDVGYGLSVADLESMSVSDREKFAPYVKSNVADEFAKSKKVTAGDIGRFKDTRVNSIKNKFTGPTGSLDHEAISKLSNDEVAALGAGWIAGNAQYLTHSQYEKVKDNASFTPGEQAAFAKQRKDAYAAYATAGTALDFESIMKGRKAKEIIELPTNLLTSKFAIEFLDESVLKELAVKLSDSDKRRIEVFAADRTNKFDRSGRTYLTAGGKHYSKFW